jgi:tRNA A-37 threonylcarbamoyl transferase component Bud32/tetratricopeptide (TPR) repeat protein
MTATTDVIGGRFQIMRVIADGGEAEVSLARDLELGLDVVLKTRRIIDGDDLGRLRREAGMLMRIVAHPGLPMVRSDLVDGDRYCLISDYVEGNDLHTLVDAQGGSGLPLPTTLGLIDQVAATLDHLHHHRPAVVHGDVKPENLVLASDGRLVLVDFGAALRVGDDGERLGTPGFSAPEVLAGEALSPAADVYSLSALAVYLLTGTVPRLGAAWPTELVDGGFARLERVLRRGLTWDPLGRPWSATEFAMRLREAAEMDVPTGTITLVLLDASPAVAKLEAAGGKLMSTVTLPSDMVLVAFSRAGDAAAATLTVAGAATIALHAGDLGGWHGATLQQLTDEVIALRRTTRETTVVCSPPVRMLLGGDDALVFEPMASGFRMVRPTVAARTSVNARSAAWIAARRARPMAGRDNELRGATAAIDRGRSSGESPMVIAIGEPGMGKTRLLAELAGRAADTGEHVLVGRCTESGGAFEPFLDALGNELFPFESGQLERDEEGWIDRRRFFGRIADAIRQLGGPVTLVIDDVQWIDGSSLALLAQLLDDLAGQLAVLAGSRPATGSSILDELRQRLTVSTITIGPLQPSSIAAMALDTGLELTDETIEGLVALTGGNPFFGLQLLTHLRDVPGHAFGTGDLPAGVREWILQRVDRLGDGVRATLAPAAVIGRSFEVIVLADVLGVSPLEALAHLDTATTAGLLIDGNHPGEFRFVHAIARTTLDDSLSPARRALLHATIAQRLEEAGDEVENLEQVLHHWFEADRLGNPLHAAEIAVEVANRATERLAHERAVSVLDRALAVLTSASASPARDRVEARVRVAHGRADFFASNLDVAIAQLYRAAELAESGDDPATLAEAALVASLHRRHGRDDPDLLHLLERASDRCPPTPAVLPAMLHIRRARLLPATVRHEQRCAMARLGLVDLVSMDPIDRATVETEVARACWGPDDAASREALTTRLIDEAGRQLAIGGPSRWTGVLIEASNHRSAARVQLGDITRALEDANRAAQLADDAGTTFLLTRVMMGQAMINSTLGNWEEAERLSTDAIRLSSRHNLVLAQMAITYSIGRDRGQQAELAQLENRLGDFVDQNPLFLAAFALVHAESNQFDDTRRLLTTLHEQGPWPRNWLWLGTMVAALEAAVLAGELDVVRRNAALLSRYSGQWALAGAELACWGPVDRVLGLAHAALGRPAEAHALLSAALASATEQHALPWVVRCQHGLNALAASSA